MENLSKNEKQRKSNFLIYVLKNFLNSLYIKKSFDREKSIFVDANCDFLKDEFLNLEKLSRLDEQGRIVVDNKLELKALVVLSMMLMGRDVSLNFINSSNINDMSYLFSPYLEKNINASIRFSEKYQENYTRDVRRFLFELKNNDEIKNYLDLLNENDFFLFFHNNNNIYEKVFKAKHEFAPSGIFFSPEEIYLENIVRFNGDLKELDTSLTSNMDCMFYKGQWNGGVLEINMKNVTTAKEMFSCFPVNIDFRGLNTSKLINASGMFSKSNVMSISIDFEQVKTLSNCFLGTRKFNYELIKNINFDFKESKVKLNNIVKNACCDFPLQELLKNKTFKNSLEKDEEQHLIKTLLRKNQIEKVLLADLTKYGNSYLTSFFKGEFDVNDFDGGVERCVKWMASTISKIENDFELMLNNFLFNQNQTKSYLLKTISEIIKENLDENWVENYFLDNALKQLIKAKQTEFVKKYLEEFKELLNEKGLIFNDVVVSNLNKSKKVVKI